MASCEPAKVGGICGAPAVDKQIAVRTTSVVVSLKAMRHKHTKWIRLPRLDLVGSFVRLDDGDLRCFGLHGLEVLPSPGCQAGHSPCGVRATLLATLLQTC